MFCFDSCTWCAAEHVQMACQIITSCVLLGREPFLQRYGDAVVRALQGLIGKYQLTNYGSHLIRLVCLLLSCGVMLCSFLAVLQLKSSHWQPGIYWKQLLCIDLSLLLV